MINCLAINCYVVQFVMRLMGPFKTTLSHTLHWRHKHFSGSAFCYYLRIIRFDATTTYRCKLTYFRTKECAEKPNTHHFCDILKIPNCKVQLLFQVRHQKFLQDFFCTFSKVFLEQTGWFFVSVQSILCYYYCYRCCIALCGHTFSSKWPKNKRPFVLGWLCHHTHMKCAVKKMTFSFDDREPPAFFSWKKVGVLLSKIREEEIFSSFHFKRKKISLFILIADYEEENFEEISSL